MWLEINCPSRWFQTGVGLGILKALSVTGPWGAQTLNFFAHRKTMNN